MLYVVINTGQKNHKTKFRQLDQVVKLAKISPGENSRLYCI